MFARKNRFSFRQGAPKRIFSTPFFIIRFDRNEEMRLFCAVVVGKKVDKRAVLRNKIKRQLVVAIKELLPSSTPVRLVVFAKKPICELSQEEKIEELKKAFKAIQIQ